jgi:hypothetical protein
MKPSLRGPAYLGLQVGHAAFTMHLGRSVETSPQEARIDNEGYVYYFIK